MDNEFLWVYVFNSTTTFIEKSLMYGINNIENESGNNLYICCMGKFMSTYF